MLPITSVERRRAGQSLLLLGLLVAGFGFVSTARAKLETWRQETASVFAKGRRDHVVVSDSGRIRLAQALSPLGTLDATRVWDLARTPGGEIYAATGDMGKVFRRDGNDGAAWSLVYDAKDTQALALAVLADGHVVVGTGPSGQVIDSDRILEHPRRVARPGRPVHLGPRRRHDGEPLRGHRAGGSALEALRRRQVVAPARHPALPSALRGGRARRHGAVYAGSDGEGLDLPRRPRTARPRWSTTLPRTRSAPLRFGPDRALYAGTGRRGRSESGGSGRGGLVFSSGDRAEPLATAAF